MNYPALKVVVSFFLLSGWEGGSTPHQTESKPIAKEALFSSQSKPQKPSPLTPEEQRRTFTLPPGFSVELVASEPEVGKPVTVAWDARGRMWTMTALEYPVDANEDSERSRELFSAGGRDKVLVFDNPSGPGPQKPRVFADKLAIPLGLLPFKDGAYVQFGTKILFLRDTNGDGVADKRETVLEGFGTQDSHLFPHQFTRGPGGWIYLAQGAFNRSNVKTKEGPIVEWNFCKMARFQPDGSRFHPIEAGLNNIWGFVIDRQGEMFIQEANDLGYPVVPFFLGANFPGIGMDRLRQYAPWQPSLANFEMGGTGLSGLALAEDRRNWPAEFSNIFYLANPITSKIQAIRVTAEGSHHKLEKLADFITSTDPWFRPVSIHFGPDGCLYIVDWYNKIISHNEVPRTHPDRDKTRGRIWRVRNSHQPRRTVVDFTKCPERQLISSLGSDNTWENRSAWQQIIDRRAVSLTPDLSRITSDAKTKADRRIAALWALEGLNKLDPSLVQQLYADPNRNIRREAVRVSANFPQSVVIANISALVSDEDPQVRAEVIRTLSSFAEPTEATMLTLISFGKVPIDAPTMPLQQGGFAKTGDAHDRDFERYLVRMALERHPKQLAKLLDSDAAKPIPFENIVFASLAHEPKASAVYLAKVLPKLDRPVTEGELQRLLGHLDQPGVLDAIQALLDSVKHGVNIAQILIRNRTQFNAAKLTTTLNKAAQRFWKMDERGREMAISLAAAFKLRQLEPALVAEIQSKSANVTVKVSALKALREMNAPQRMLFESLIENSPPGSTLREEAVLALTASVDRVAPVDFFNLIGDLTAKERRLGLDQLSSNKEGGLAILKAVRGGIVAEDVLDGTLLERLQLLLGNSTELETLIKSKPGLFRPILRLDGKGSFAKTDISLLGPFTIEAWVRLDPNINNLDSLLGRPGVADFNFHDGKFRFWAGPHDNDILISKKNVVAESWVHVAISRDAANHFKSYHNGELDADASKSFAGAITALNIGMSNHGATTAGAISEVRIWKHARKGDDIRADFDQSFEGRSLPEGLIRYFPGAGPWGTLQGNAKIVWTSDHPPLLSPSEIEVQTKKFDRYRAIVGQPGDVKLGAAVFVKHCQVCHAVQGKGGNIGPTLSGAGVMGTESLLRNVLTPSAAMEAGYRSFVVVLRSGVVKDGYLAAQTPDHIILRRPNFQDERIDQSEILQSRFSRRSVMPDNLQDAMSADDFRNLFGYLRTLK